LSVLTWHPLITLQVRFSTQSFGVEAAHVAAEALRAVAHCLEHADISDIIAGRPVRSWQQQQQQQPQQQWLRVIQPSHLR